MLKNTFCSSPWFHIRINPAGDFLPCRWSSVHATSNYNISTTSIFEYFNSEVMQGIRREFLSGHRPDICSSCYYEDDYNKVSGRLKQLLKSGINVGQFDKSFCSSPHYKHFDYSFKNEGETEYYPVDLQIDLGNTCNSACIMCFPTYSSRLENDYRQLHHENPDLFPKYSTFKNWANDPKLVDKFVNELAQIPNIRYIHFLGGETLYLESFYNICDRLIELDLAKDISIGTTTNCTVYTPRLESIIRQFKHVHLGLSIESFTTLNNYIRWPSQINNVIDHLDKFVKLRIETDLHLSLRITPSIFSIYHIDTIFEFIINNSLIAESCNILSKPSCLRIELLPSNLVNECIEKINNIISKYNIQSNDNFIINRRRDDLAQSVISDIIFEYKQFLETMTVPDDVEQQRYSLVKFIKAFESIRSNCILDYLPEYEEFLRSYGY